MSLSPRFLNTVRRKIAPALLGRSTPIASSSKPSITSHRALTVAAGTSEDFSAEDQDHKIPQTQDSEGWLYIDSVFPVRLGTWDFRHYIGVLREETLLERLSTILGSVKAHDFRVTKLEPHAKDGGVFVKFEYQSSGESEAALSAILRELKESAAKHGGIPSWIGLPNGNAWLVKGKPWKEDMHYFASPLLKVSFDGPDLRDETLYDLMRPYGRIVQITPPSPAPAGTLRSATVAFRSIHYASTAKNTLHGLAVPAETGSGVTRIRATYQQPIQAHVIRDYISSHPKIFLPVFIFLLGSLTYTIFDPIRVFMVEGKLNEWFDYRQYSAYKWLRSNMIDRFNIATILEERQETAPAGTGAWKERQDAEGALGRYLSDMPNTVTFVHGPQGSGKTRMITALLKDSKRKALVIDVGALSKASSDVALVSGLAGQTGYWPVFSFLNSMNNLIDLASVGLIGQKAGLSSSLNDQLKQILDVVGSSLRTVNTTYRKNRKRQLESERIAQLRAAEEAKVRERIRKGIWHDPRLDCIAGNGVMSELGFGDEYMGPNDADIPVSETRFVEKNLSEKEQDRSGQEQPKDSRTEQEEANRKQRTEEDLQAIEAMPIVILKGFESKGGSARREELLDALAQWAAGLAESQVAHVIVVSDNRENAKQLAKALPSKPLNLVALSDADSSSALQFVQQKLHDSGMDVNFTREQTAYLQRLGGRASDLESVIHKVRSGMTVQEAVDDIVSRGVSELRKSAFGDDAEDAKSLPWSREQAWILMKLLAKKPEVPYHEVLMDFPFKSDESPLREMEHSELITISTHNGRPSTIRPGKPVYKYVFEKLVEDPIFQATQDIAFNQKIISANEVTVKACEDELITLNAVEAGTSHWWGSRRAVTGRQEYLLKKMRTAGEKIESLEKQNASLKKILSKISS